MEELVFSPPNPKFFWGEVHTDSKIISTTDTMGRPPDIPPRPPEAILDLSQPSSSKIYHFFQAPFYNRYRKGCRPNWFQLTIINIRSPYLYVILTKNVSV
jgi:hypothetical protein